MFESHILKSLMPYVPVGIKETKKKNQILINTIFKPNFLIMTFNLSFCQFIYFDFLRAIGKFFKKTHKIQKTEIFI